MKKTVIIATLLLLIIACTTSSPEQTTPPEANTLHEQHHPEETETTTTPQETPEPVEAVMPPAPVESKILVEKSRRLSPELRDLLQKADTEVKSMSYVYSESPSNAGFDTHLIKGTRIKILLFEKNDYIVDDYFDVVYLDTVQKTAYGACENRKRCLTKIVDNTKRVYDLRYEPYRTKTAYEWIKDIDYAEIVGLETINNHAVTRIATQQKNVFTELWVDNRFGIPHRIKTTGNGQEKTYTFKNPQFNNLKDSDATLSLPH